MARWRAPGGRLTEKELATLGIDPSTARRQFKRHYGMTFQAYHRARRTGLPCIRSAKTAASRGQNRSGFESASGFREAFNRIFGEPPSLAKRRPPLFVERFETPLARWLLWRMMLVRLLEFADRRAFERELTILRRRLGTNIVPGTHPHLDATRKQIAEYFAGKRFESTVQIAPIGSDFQQRA